MKPYKILPDLEQGSQEWLECRKRHLTGTEIAHLWSKQIKFEQLRQEKLGIIEKPQLNCGPINEGHYFEPIIRNHLMSTPLGKKLSPNGECPTPCLESIEEPFFMVSLDGLTEMGIPVEIKNSYSKSSSSYDDVLENGSFSKTGKNAGYYAQVQWEIYLTGAPCAVFCTHKSLDGTTFCPANFRTQIIKRDPELIEELKELAYAFKEYMNTQTLPEVSVGSRTFTQTPSEEIVQLIEQYKTQNEAYEGAYAVFKKLKEERDTTAKLLVDLLPEGCSSLETTDFIVAREQRKGSVDVEGLTKHLISEGLMTLEQINEFRRSSSWSNKIKILK